MAAQVHSPMDENEMVMTFIDTQETPYYERLLTGIGKPFSEIIKHEDMTEMRLQSSKIKDFTALEAMTKLIQSGNYGNTSEMNSHTKEERVVLVLQSQNGRGPNSDSPINAQCTIHRCLKRGSKSKIDTFKRATREHSGFVDSLKENH